MFDPDSRDFIVEQENEYDLYLKVTCRCVEDECDCMTFEEFLKDSLKKQQAYWDCMDEKDAKEYLA